MGILTSKDKSPPKSGEVLPPETAKAEAPKSEVKDAVKDLVEVKGNTALAEMYDGFDEGSTGLDQVQAKDLIIPRLTILQKLSPQLENRKPEFIPDAQAGDFCDVALGDIFRGELHLLPCYFATVYLEWGAKRGDGLIHNHGLDASIMKKTKKDENFRNICSKELGAERDGTIIAETATWFVINLTAGGRRSFLPLSSTQLKASRQMLTLITNQRLPRRDGSEYQPPIFFRSFKATLTHESNEKGDWFGWKFTPDKTVLELDPSKNLLANAKEFMEQARSGFVTGDLSSYAEDGTHQHREGMTSEENKSSAM